MSNKTKNKTSANIHFKLDKLSNFVSRSEQKPNISP